MVQTSKQELDSLWHQARRILQHLVDLNLSADLARRCLKMLTLLHERTNSAQQKCVTRQDCPRIVDDQYRAAATDVNTAANYGDLAESIFTDDRAIFDGFMNLDLDLFDAIDNPFSIGV